jgi:hypothetical protein
MKRRLGKTSRSPSKTFKFSPDKKEERPELAPKENEWEENAQTRFH